MKKPQVYFVDGTAIAVEGEHIFKEVVSGYGTDIEALLKVADVIKLSADSDGVYYLKNEGTASDSGEKYLISSKGIVSCGNTDKDGSIGSILSPIRAYNNYIDNIKAIKDILDNVLFDNSVNRTLIRLLFIGVCGELEGYLHTTIISLIQGSREVFLAIRDCRGLPSSCSEEKQWRNDIVNAINDKFQFQHIRNKKAKEREIYEKLIAEQLIVSQDLIDYIEWRNKLAHRVPYYDRPISPSKEDVLNFIVEIDKIVAFIDRKIECFKSEWLRDF